MGNYIFILALLIPLCSVVSGNLTVCLSLNNQDEILADDYILFVKTFKEELTALLEENDSKFFKHIDFNFTHPAISAFGEINDVTVENINTFDLEFFKDVDIKNDIEIFTLTFNNISVVGEYSFIGNIGDLFNIWGAGDFWLNVLNFSVSASTKLPIINSTSVCVFVDVKLNLENMEGWFNNLMDGDKELEELINHTIMEIAPDAVAIIWTEIKEAVDGPLEEWINSIINKHSMSIIKQVQQSQVDV